MQKLLTSTVFALVGAAFRVRLALLALGGAFDTNLLRTLELCTAVAAVFRFGATLVFLGAFGR